VNSSVELLWQDVRFGARQLRRAPGFLAAAVITLALGIGANTAMFGVVYAVLLKPLPFEQPERLVSVWSTAPGIGWDQAVLAAAQYFTYREENRVFDDLAVWVERPVTVTGKGEPDRVAALHVTDGFLPVLRTQPMLGRGFSRDDDRPGAQKCVVLTYGYWQQKFGGDPGVVGRSITVDGAPHQVVGVMRRDFRFLGTTAAMLVPLAFNRSAITIQDFSYRGIARLEDGMSVEQANADVGRMIGLVPGKFPPSPGLGPNWFADARMGPDVHPLSQDAAGDAGSVLWVLMGTIGMVLLIACANVANLFLVRAEGRQQELAVRAALGAGKGRIARALLAESVLLGLVGGGVGIGLAYAVLGVVRVLAPAALPRVEEIGMDVRVVLFAAGLSVVAGLLFGLAPVLKLGSPRLGALGDGGRSASDGRGRHLTRSVLVVAEIALALVLLVASGLMVRTFQSLRHVDPGFTHAEELLTLSLSIPRAAAKDGQEAIRRHEEIVRRIEQVPGVQAVGLTSSVPLDGNGMGNPMLVEQFPVGEGQAVRSRRMKWISPGYFETMGTPLVAGRHVTWSEMYGFGPVVLINERLAREYWPTAASAIGKRVRATRQSPWREIIGVVRDERQDGLAQEPPPQIYYPCLVKDFWIVGTTQGQRTLTYVIRSPRTGSPAFLQEVRQAVWSVSRDLPLARVRTQEQLMSESMSQTSFALVLLAIAAGVSLLLGVVGIYGVVSYIAAQRTREVGIRMALGAAPSDVARLFLRHGAGLALAGVAVGLAAAAALSRVMASLLFGVTGTDPATYAVAAAVLGGIAILAGYLPSRRAARREPVSALRS